jgi:hypothetical protein
VLYKGVGRVQRSVIAKARATGSVEVCRPGAIIRAKGSIVAPIVLVDGALEPLVVSLSISKREVERDMVLKMLLIVLGS